MAARDGDALLLAVGKFRWIGILLAVEPHLAHQRARCFFNFHAAAFEDVDEQGVLSNFRSRQITAFGYRPITKSATINAR